MVRVGVASGKRDPARLDAWLISPLNTGVLSWRAEQITVVVRLRVHTSLESTACKQQGERASPTCQLYFNRTVLATHMWRCK
jgi:hypothetical protein